MLAGRRGPRSVPLGLPRASWSVRGIVLWLTPGMAALSVWSCSIRRLRRSAPRQPRLGEGSIECQRGRPSPAGPCVVDRQADTCANVSDLYHMLKVCCFPVVGPAFRGTISLVTAEAGESTVVEVATIRDVLPVLQGVQRRPTGEHACCGLWWSPQSRGRCCLLAESFDWRLATWPAEG